MKLVKKKQAGRRTTIYRMTGVAAFADAIRSKYLDQEGFDDRSVEVGDRPAYLVAGAMSKDRAAWCSTLTSLTGDEVEIGGVTPAGILLVRPDEDEAVEGGIVYALSYGMGFQLLDPSRIDNLFGQRIRASCAQRWMSIRGRLVRPFRRVTACWDLVSVMSERLSAG